MKNQQNKPLIYFITSYLQHRPLFFSFIRPQEAYLINQQKNTMKHPILDYGCGDGFFASLIFDKQEVDIGLDIYNSRANQAKQTHIYKKIVLYDGNKIPYPNNSFQTVFSNCVMEHIPHLDAALKEIYRVLKPGGKLITTVMADKWENYMVGPLLLGRLYKEYMRRKQEHFNLLSQDDWDKKFKNADFSIIKRSGYLPKRTAGILDLSHYLSAGSLISYRLFKKWVLFPSLSKMMRIDRLINSIDSRSLDKNDSAAFFYILQK